jgi:hypothetical protein
LKAEHHQKAPGLSATEKARGLSAVEAHQQSLCDITEGLFFYPAATKNITRSVFPLAFLVHIIPFLYFSSPTN